MNNRIKLCLLLLATAGAAKANHSSNSHYLGRGASNDMSRELINTAKAYNSEGEGSFVSAAITGFYNRSFNNDRSNGLGAMFSFGGSEINEMTIGGGTTARTDFNIDGYQLGLGNRSTDGDAKMKLSPQVYQAGADLMLYAGASRNEAGMWVKAHSSVGVMAVDPKLSVTGDLGTLSEGTEAYPLGTFDNEENIGPNDANSSIAEAFKGEKSFFKYHRGMKYGKIDGKQTSGTRFGDIELSVGYNFMADEDKIIGVGARVIIPTSNRPTGEYVFEPIFGRGGNWGLGAELFAKANLWSSDEGDSSLDFLLNGHATHLFKAEQTRSFDTTLNGGGSRYMLVGVYNTQTEATAEASEDAFDANQELGSLINYSTLACKADVSVEGAIAAMFDYNHNGWNVSLGAEFWGTAKENIEITGTLNSKLVILGRQRAEIKEGANFIQLGLCEPGATMNSAAAHTITFNTDAATTQDSALALVNDTTNGVKFGGAADSKIPADGLSAESASNRARHAAKVFANVGHRWADVDHQPFIGLTGSAEFATSKRNAISQWGVALQGGICF